MPSDSCSAADYLASSLERLMAFPLDTPSDVARWDAEADEVERTLKEQYPSFEPWEECWHFMADADIRFRDHEYRDYQHGLISGYVARLRQPPTA